MADRLDSFFNPGTVALIGASRDPKSVGYGILKNLATGCFFETKFCRPFGGKVFPVNPNADKILNDCITAPRLNPN